MTLHRVLLTRHGTSRLRDVHTAHAIIAAATEGTTARPLWSHPTRQLLIVRADHLHLPSEMVHEHHQHPYRFTGNSGDRISLSAILNPVTRHEQKATIVPIGQTTEWLTPRLRGQLSWITWRSRTSGVVEVGEEAA